MSREYQSDPTRGGVAGPHRVSTDGIVRIVLARIVAARIVAARRRPRLPGPDPPS